MRYRTPPRLVDGAASISIASICRKCSAPAHGAAGQDRQAQALDEPPEHRCPTETARARMGAWHGGDADMSTSSAASSWGAHAPSSARTSGCGRDSRGRRPADPRSHRVAHRRPETGWPPERHPRRGSEGELRGSGRRVPARPQAAGDQLPSRQKAIDVLPDRARAPPERGARRARAGTTIAAWLWQRSSLHDIAVIRGAEPGGLRRAAFVRWTRADALIRRPTCWRCQGPDRLRAWAPTGSRAGRPDLLLRVPRATALEACGRYTCVPDGRGLPRHPLVAGPDRGPLSTDSQELNETFQRSHGRMRSGRSTTAMSLRSHGSRGGVHTITLSPAGDTAPCRPEDTVLDAILRSASQRHVRLPGRRLRRVQDAHDLRPGRARPLLRRRAPRGADGSRAGSCSCQARALSDLTDRADLGEQVPRADVVARRASGRPLRRRPSLSLTARAAAVTLTGTGARIRERRDAYTRVTSTESADG